MDIFMISGFFVTKRTVLYRFLVRRCAQGEIPERVTRNILCIKHSSLQVYTLGYSVNELLYKKRRSCLMQFEESQVKIKSSFIVRKTT